MSEVCTRPQKAAKKSSARAKAAPIPSPAQPKEPNEADSLAMEVSAIAGAFIMGVVESPFGGGYSGCDEVHLADGSLTALTKPPSDPDYWGESNPWKPIGEQLGSIGSALRAALKKSLRSRSESVGPSLFRRLLVEAALDVVEQLQLAYAGGSLEDLRTLRKAVGAKPFQVAAKPASDLKVAKDWMLVSEALHAASKTDEPHDFSGDSDRLLRAGSALARQAAENGIAVDDQERHVFDIAALINASRRVPGDTESPERATYLQTAAVQLALLSHIKVEEIIVDRARSVARATNTSFAARVSDCSISISLYDSIFMRLDRAQAVLDMLVHVFGGDADTDEPSATPGLHGTLQHAKWMLNELHQYLLGVDANVPNDLRGRVFEASELITLLEHLEANNGFEFSRHSDFFTCSYLDAAREAVGKAKVTLDQSKEKAQQRRA